MPGGGRPPSCYMPSHAICTSAHPRTWQWYSRCGPAAAHKAHDDAAPCRSFILMGLTMPRPPHNASRLLTIPRTPSQYLNPPHNASRLLTMPDTMPSMAYIDWSSSETHATGKNI